MAKRTVILRRSQPRDQAICRIVDMLEDLPADQGYRVEVHEHASTRTSRQNRTLWWIYENMLALGGETMAGWEKEDLHEFFLLEFFGSTVTNMFGRKRLKPVRRSSRLSKMEFAGLVDFIYRFMATRGVVLPDPDPEMATHEEREVA